MRCHEILDTDISCVGNGECRCWTGAVGWESTFPASQRYYL